jgi:hypothetical protein
MHARLRCVFLSAGFAVSAQLGPPRPPAAIEVEFLADGRCTVSAVGAAFHSTLTYTPPPPVPPISERRCAIPPVPAGAAVDLTVRLPPGAAPSLGGEEPRLTWARRDHRWVGSAALATAPSVVRIPGPGNGAADRAPATWARRWATIGVSAAAALAIASWLWWRDRDARR